jgi:CDP-diglyceride synthetase
MSGEFLYGVDQWLIAFMMMVLLLLSTEFGFRTGRKLRTGIEEGAKSQVSTISGAIIGVLALLLGFTFAMALARYERRKQLVLEESNAIGTAYLRSRLLPEPAGTEVAGLLRSYVGAGLDFYRG